MHALMHERGGPRLRVKVAPTIHGCPELSAENTFEQIFDFQDR